MLFNFHFVIGLLNFNILLTMEIKISVRCNSHKRKFLLFLQLSFEPLEFLNVYARVGWENSNALFDWLCIAVRWQWQYRYLYKALAHRYVNFIPHPHLFAWYWFDNICIDWRYWCVGLGNKILLSYTVTETFNYILLIFI